jgi:hypothetical protein
LFSKRVQRNLYKEKDTNITDIILFGCLLFGYYIC